MILCQVSRLHPSESWPEAVSGLTRKRSVAVKPARKVSAELAEPADSLNVHMYYMTDPARRQTGRTALTPNWERTEKERTICKALEEVAAQVGAKNVQAVAVAYVMQKTTHVFPIVGGRTVDQLEANIEALDVALSQEQIKYLESVFPFEAGVPYWHCVSSIHLQLIPQIH